MHLPLKENVWSRHQRLFGENVGKIKMEKVKGLHILKMKVRELFMHGEGISIPRARHKGRQSLIKCANHDFAIYFIFPFFLSFSLFMFLSFCGRHGCFPCSYVFLNCHKEIRPT